MNLERLSAFGPGRYRRVQGATGIDDEQVACREPARQIGEACVLDRIGLDIRDEQSHLVASEATRLGRFGRFEIGRQFEIRVYTRCSHRASSRWAANRSPL